jgi:hypothetical protein
MDRHCKLCQSATRAAFSATVLGKYPAQYRVCDSCGFLFVESPHWLDEAYASAIAYTDVGLVHRNLVNRDLVSAVAYRLFGPGARILDVAGGYGLLARLLRDAGFDAWTQDDYCQNLFAELFSPEDGDRHFDLLTAFEVLEHLRDPVEFLEEGFTKRGKHPLLISTLVYEGDVPARDWHYYAFDMGQHIAFYTSNALRVLGNRIGMECCSLSDSLHFFYPEGTDHGKSLRFLKRRNVRRWYCRRVQKRMKRQSLLPADAVLATQSLREKQGTEPRLPPSAAY